MSPVAITFALIFAALGMFIWGRIPAVIVAICVSLILYFTGILPVNQALGGFGDLTVIFIAALFVIAAGLEAAGVTAWAGQFLVEKAGKSQTRLMVLIMLVAAVFTASISVNGTVAALLPVVVVIGVRLNIPTSQLLLPMCFATHGGTMLTLIGAPLNVLASNAAVDAGYSPIGFFEFAIAGVPIFIGTAIVILLTRRFLLPHTNGASLPPDFSSQAKTLVEQYRLEDGMHRLKVRASSSLIGKPRLEVDLKEFDTLGLVGIVDGNTNQPLQRATIAEGDYLMVRGDAETAGQLAADLHLSIAADDSQPDGAGTLFNRNSGLAEVIIPTRSKLIGETTFPGMTVSGGDLMVLAVQRAGLDLGARPTKLEVGDHVLLQGTWKALDKHLADPKVLVVDSPDVVRRQAVPLGLGAVEALCVMAALVIMLATGWVPGAVAALICAVALVLLGVITVPQAYKGIDWNTCFLIAGMIPLATAMTQTGAAELIADWLIGVVGGAGPRALLVGLFLVTLAITSVMSNTATALLMFPIGIATAAETGVSAMPFIIGIAIGSHAAVLTPVATPVNMMVLGPGGYKFSDYTKFGLPITLWWLVVVAFLLPLYWKF